MAKKTDDMALAEFLSIMNREHTDPNAKTDTLDQLVCPENYAKLGELFFIDYSSFVKAVDAYRVPLRARLRNLLEATGKSDYEIAKDCGIKWHTILFRSSTAEYRLNMQNTTSVCYGPLKMSVHEFLSRQKLVVTLPKNMNLVARILISAKQNSLVEELFAPLKQKYSGPPLQKRLPDEVFVERLAELSADRGCNFDALFEPDGQHTIQSAYYRRCRDITENPADAKRPMTLRFALATAAVTGLPVDYLVVEDYIPFAEDVLFYDGYGGQPMPMRDGQVLEKLSLLLRATPEDRDYVIGRLMAEVWNPAQ